MIRTLLERTRADLLLAAVTVFELVRFLLDDFEWATGIHVAYLTMHALVLVLVLLRRRPEEIDQRPGTLSLCGISYLYPYLMLPIWDLRQPIPIAPEIGETIVFGSALLSLASLAILGTSFGIRPARRRLVKGGPFRLVRHPIYLSYILSDIGLLLAGFDSVLMLAFLGSWAAMVARLVLEERVLSGDPAWNLYVQTTRWRLLPGVF